MPLEIVTVPCRTDNYAYLLHDPATGTTALVDAPEAAPIMAAAEDRGWSIDTIFITHHHGDHVEGVEALRQAFGCDVVGGAADAHRLPPLDREVAEGDTIAVGNETGRVIDVSGHTVGHLAFHFPDSHAAFTADSLMALGCGRVFEGTMPQMWASLSKLASLPDDTHLFSGHEYTAANAAFALTIEPDNPDLKARANKIKEMREQGLATVPSTLAEEKATNPFLRASLPEVKRSLGMTDAEDALVFAEIRTRKDRF